MNKQPNQQMDTMLRGFLRSKSLLLCCLLLAVSCATGQQLADEAGAEPSAPTPASEPQPVEPAEEIEAPRVDLGPAKQLASEALAASVTRAGERVSGWWQPLPQQPSYAVLLDEQRAPTHTLSLGTVGSGELLNASKLALDGKFHSVIERHRRRNTQYASDALIEVLTDAAQSVGKAFPGSKLRIGNLSRKHGGDIPWSSSHNSGRDADLAFFCKRRDDGEPVLAPDLLHFDATGQAIERPDLVFDVERNWQLVKALLSHERVHMQWIFVSNGLKSLLLEHARELGEDSALIERAGKVLHQPTDAPPHNDHFHVRITCPERDRLEGCLDYGPRWEWVDWHYDALLARSLELARAFREPREETRLAALDVLERIRSPYAPELALAAALHDKSDAVRQRALEVAVKVPYWSGAAVAAAIKFVERDEFPVDEKKYAYSVLRRSVDPLAIPTLRSRISDTELDEAERVAAARSLQHFMKPELVPFVLEQMAKQPAAVRAKLAVALRRITNRAEDIDWAAAGEQKRTEKLAEWKKWWAANKDAGRDAWLEEGFVAQGCQADEIFTAAAAGDIIALLRGAPDHISYNANLTLKRVTGRWAPLEAWNYARLHRYWSKWWKAYHQPEVASR